MAAETPNTLKGAGIRSTVKGDVPDDLKRRYYLDGRGGPGLGFYADATTPTPAFRDRGDRLTTPRSDPHVIRHLTAIARHRGWTRVTLTGEPAFRREAWLVARAEGLEVRGYRPTPRDLQDLDRRIEQERRREAWSTLGRDLAAAATKPDLDLYRTQAKPQMKVVDSVVRSRFSDPVTQARLLDAARDRIAGWLERGGRFEASQERQRSADARERYR